MCRSKHNGDRQCPCRQTPEFKKRKAIQRRNNRRAVKNLKSFFTDNALEQTAELTKNILPSEVAKLMEVTELSTDILGVDTPPTASVGTEDQVIDVDDMAKSLLNESCDKKVKLPYDSRRGFGGGLMSDFAEGRVRPFTDLDPEMIDEHYISEVAQRTVNAYMSSQNSKDVFPYLMDVDFSHNEDFSSAWSDLEGNISNTINQRVWENDLVLRDKLYGAHSAVEDSMPIDVKELLNNKDVIGSPLSDDDMKLLLSKISSHDNARSSFLVEYGLSNLLSNDKHHNSKVISMGAGLYAVDFGDDDSDADSYVVYVFNTGNSEKFNAEEFSGDSNDVEVMSRDMISKLCNNDGRLKVLDHLTDDELRRSCELTNLSYSSLSADIDEMSVRKESELDKAISAINSYTKSAGIARTIACNNTFLQQNYSYDFKIPNDPNNATTMFNIGVCPIRGNFSHRAKKFAESWDVSKIIRAMNSQGASAMQDRSKSDMRAEINSVIDSLDDEEKKLIRDYSSESYRDFSMTALNERGTKAHSLGYEFMTEELHKVNKAIKRVQANNTQPRMLARGVRLDPSRTNIQEYYDNIRVGDTHVTTKLTSTTVEGETLAYFAGKGVPQSVITVYMPTTKGIQLGGETAELDDAEAEVLLGVGEKFTVIDKHLDKNTNTAYIYMADAEKVIG